MNFKHCVSMAKENILDKGIGVGNTSILDTAMIKLSEFGVDELSAKMGFNGTMTSGFSKVGSAVALSFALPKGIVQNLNSGLMADGMSDLYVSVKKKFFSGSDSNGSNSAEVTGIRVV